MLFELWKGGDRVAAKPEDSTWYLMYITCPMLNVPKFHTQFHRRFRIPYQQFIQFVSDARDNSWFPHWNKWNSSSPLELLLLGAFHYIGRPRCIGSTDATHIAIEKCACRLHNNHLGSKQHLTTRTFNLTVNHRCRILSTTIGMPGRWNDKTVVLFDEFVSGIYEGESIDIIFKCYLLKFALVTIFFNNSFFKGKFIQILHLICLNMIMAAMSLQRHTMVHG
jgi:hypothetical protein